MPAVHLQGSKQPCTRTQSHLRPPYPSSRLSQLGAVRGGASGVSMRGGRRLPWGPAATDRWLRPTNNGADAAVAALAYQAARKHWGGGRVGSPAESEAKVVPSGLRQVPVATEEMVTTVCRDCPWHHPHSRGSSHKSCGQQTAHQPLPVSQKGKSDGVCSWLKNYIQN